MANTKFIALSPVHVSTTETQVVADPGQKGVLYVNVGDNDGLQTFRNIADVEQNYDADSPIWNQAHAYFEGAPDGQAQVMSVNSKGTLFEHATAPQLTATTTDNSVTFSTNAPADGSTPSTADLIVDRLLKYYGAGFQYIVYPCAQGDEDTAIALSNFVEAQDTGYLFIDVTTDPTKPVDFSAFDAIKDNRATKLVSSNSTLDPDSVLASEALGKYVELPIGSNYKFIDQLQEVQPQDQYEFSNDDLALYEKYNVATYAYENKVPMITNGRSLSGVSTGIMVFKDYMTITITNRVADYLRINKPPYNASTVKAIISLIQGVLANAVSNSNIEEFDLPKFDADALSDEIKATGKLTGIKWSYKPMRFIDDAWFEQGLELTVNE
ncbi:hypothetical protein IWT140_01707 [Secundilactobacillus pentosiphilus]|uniref:Uncharacterized protein n=1 Tax=Secundilactobacillus pentosiphilus TaxID=1714682 RepID=A0A1Z5IQR3_9LACO|nr:hypothetical protein [Secundilactobacillus pentosiphilus]GAX04070.1 hypothetical protein IWT140_01707 [Secundilactobacillus pentosiphilus]